MEGLWEEARRTGQRGPGSACPMWVSSAPRGPREAGRPAEAGGQGEEATAREDVVIRASGLERGRCRAILVNVAAGQTAAPPTPDVPAEPDMLMSLASVSQLLICGRSDLLYFRSHEINLHSSSRELPRRYECDFLTAVTVGLNMTEMMRGKDSFLDRKKHTLSPWSPPRMEQSDGKSLREREGQPLTLCDVPDPPLSRFF